MHSVITATENPRRPAARNLEQALERHFNLPGFRLGQREIIESALAGRDVLAVLPTGGGKSLCYQLPALVKGCLVIVISPLIALMKDQVDALKRFGIPAGSIHSGQSEEEKRDVFRRLGQGGPFLLYVSPERVQKDGFRRWVKTIGVGLFAIDEAHCVSQWGHDFREEYSQLNLLKSLRPEVPVLALTASATPFVLKDIARQLELRDPSRHVHGFYRPNLYYQVETCADEQIKLIYIKRALAQNPVGRILIYCGTRTTTEELSASLGRQFEKVGYYHAGLSASERTRIQNEYAAGEIRILCATNAFGMGIDHPDVRLVVHYQMPGNIDALYQEMGRAGRDGLDSTCLLLYARKDKGLQSFFITRSDCSPAIQKSRWRGLDNLVEYAESSECRHAEILTYFQDAQRIRTCGHCDACLPGSSRRVVVAPELLQGSVKETASRSTAKARRSKTPPVGEVLSEAEAQLFEALRDWRRQKARELDVPAFVVLSDRSLRHFAQLGPRKLADLPAVYGMGPQKIEKFGSEILAEILLHQGRT